MSRTKYNTLFRIKESCIRRFKKLNRENFVEELLKRREAMNKGNGNEEDVNKLKSRQEALYQLIKKVYEDNQKGLLDSEMTTKQDSSGATQDTTTQNGGVGFHQMILNTLTQTISMD